MYTYSENGGYTFTDTAEIHQYSSQTTTFQKTISTPELQWECTSNGYSLVQASDILFQGDPVNTPVKVDSQPEEEREDRRCQTWYVASKPVEKPSRSAEYVAPHKRYYGYDRTRNQKGSSTIRGRTISSSGETTHSHDAQSRSNSRQSQHLRRTPDHRRSVSRSSYRSKPAPVVSRERAQPRAHLMPVVNLTRRSYNQTSQKNQRVSHERRNSGAASPVCPEVSRRARKVRGKWIKGDAEPTPAKVCFQFEKNGCCSWGERCRFAHVVKKKNTYQFDPSRYNPTPKNSYKSNSSRATSVARNRFDFQGDDGASW